MNRVSFDICCWNPRGLGNSDKCSVVQADLVSAHPSIVALQETKIVDMSAPKASSFPPSNLRAFDFINATGSLGGILSAWDENLFSQTGRFTTSSALSIDLLCRADSSSLRVTNVYGPCARAEKESFLSDIDTHAPTDDSPWIVLGDFNLSRAASDRNNRNFSLPEASLFNEFVNRLCLVDLPLRDRRFTWSNQRDSPTLVRLDWVFVNLAWNDRFPSSSLASLSRDSSDHVALIASISTAIPRSSVFRFKRSWSLHPAFRASISRAWGSAFRTDATGRIVARLRRCRISCKLWTKRSRPAIQREQDARILINIIDLLEEHRVLSPPENLLRSLTMDALHTSIKERAIYWRSRAKIRYAIEGDENTGFFHASASCRRRRNTIASIEVDGVSLTSHQDKASALKTFYSALLGSPSSCNWTFDLASLYPSSTPLPASLSAPFLDDEIKLAFIRMNQNSSPGPDGFGPSFYSTFWDTVAPDIRAMFSDFYSGTIDLSRINRAFLVMLPKFTAVVRPSDFRPISLQNCVMKGIPKALTTCLQCAIHSLVNGDQTGFLSGRRISENIIYAADLVRCCHLRKSPAIVFKIDFRKAFDSVNWDSLLVILKARGFDDTWIAWMHDILHSSLTSVLLNGVPGDWIKCRNGLRQGDTLSPYLFIIVADVLQRMIHQAFSDGALSHPIDASLPPAVLQYADDTLILCRASVDAAARLKNILDSFAIATGLTINFRKSCFVTMGILPDEAKAIADVLLCPISSFPQPYLGLPLSYEAPQFRLLFSHHVLRPPSLGMARHVALIRRQADALQCFFEQLAYLFYVFLLAATRSYREFGQETSGLLLDRQRFLLGRSLSNCLGKGVFVCAGRRLWASRSPPTKPGSPSQLRPQAASAGAPAVEAL
ncbi:unnamed protein product [Alopecurus aequalis]